MTEWIGWTATALFTLSYFFEQPRVLRRVQMAAAALWVGYGVMMQAVPVVVANVLVMGAAAARSWHERRTAGSGM
jgi:hypothetical protein